MNLVKQGDGLNDLMRSLLAQLPIILWSRCVFNSKSYAHRWPLTFIFSWMRINTKIVHGYICKGSIQEIWIGIWSLEGVYHMGFFLNQKIYNTESLPWPCTAGQISKEDGYWIDNSSNQFQKLTWNCLLIVGLATYGHFHVNLSVERRYICCLWGMRPSLCKEMFWSCFLNVLTRGNCESVLDNS